MTQQTTDDAVALFSGFVEEFDGYYQNRLEFDERFKLWSGLLDKYHVPGGLSLDVGCGTGVFSVYLALKAGRVIGVDGSAEMLAFCEKRRQSRGLENLRFMQGRLPDVKTDVLENADLIISSSVVEYVQDLDGALALYARLLKPNATLIVSMPNLFSVSRIYERLRYRSRDIRPSTATFCISRRRPACSVAFGDSVSSGKRRITTRTTRKARNSLARCTCRRS